MPDNLDIPVPLWPTPFRQIETEPFFSRVIYSYKLLPGICAVVLVQQAAVVPASEENDIESTHARK